MCTEVARKSGKVYGYTKYREDLGLPNKDTFYCWPELFPISEDLKMKKMKNQLSNAQLILIFTYGKYSTQPLQ